MRIEQKGENMKKLLLILPAVALAACSQGQKSDMEILESAVQDTEIIAQGKMGDFMVQVQETEALKKIADKEKTAKFLSVENPDAKSKEGYCLVNVIPVAAMEKVGMENSTCHYRIYCGQPGVVDYDKMYAVEVCK